MTVQELINHLQQYPADTPVVTVYDSGCVKRLTPTDIDLAPLNGFDRYVSRCKVPMGSPVVYIGADE